MKGKEPDKKHRHPHAYTLELLVFAIGHLPPTFPADRKKHYGKRLKEFTRNVSANYDDIHKVIVELGKESWAERKAYEDMYERYGRASEEAHLLENLDVGLRDKYEKFLHEGGKISHIESAKSGEDIWKVSHFERYFGPEEHFAIKQALLAARDQAREEIEDLVTGKKSEEYANLVEGYRGSRGNIEKGIDELRNLAMVSDRWQDTIMDRVKVLEEGWSVVEQGVSQEQLKQELNYWRGTLEAFLTA